MAEAKKALATLMMLVRRLLTAAERGKKVAPRRSVSRERRAQLKLHGAYIGHLRHLKPRQKAQVKAVKAKKGYETAIKTAKEIAAK